MKNKCLNCCKPVKNKYCNVSCQNTHQCTGRKISEESLIKRTETNKKKWKTFTVNCHKCDKEFEIEEFNVSEPKKEKYFCSRSCANSRSWSEEEKHKKSKTNKNSEKVLLANKENGKKRAGFYYGGGKRKSVVKMVTECEYCGEDIIHKKTVTRKYHKECWLKCSGGLRKGSSRGKCGWYKGYWCDSSYELAWVIYALEHNIKFKRNLEGFPYVYKDKVHKFYPDFIVGGKYLEIKNFRSDLTDAKIKQFPHEIDVYYKDYIKENILPYVIGKYGNNFIELYELKKKDK